MPARHQAARFGKEQKEDPIDDDQRFVERWTDATVTPRSSAAAQNARARCPSAS